MALIDCYECGRQISTQAPACPQCGAPRQQQQEPTLPPKVATQPPPVQQQEEMLHSDKYVKVSTARVIIRETTYALRNLTSVRMAETPGSVGGAILFIVFGLLMVLASVAVFSDSVSAAIACMLIALGLIAVGIWQIRAAKPTYHVAITSSSGEFNAMSSQDGRYIQTVVTRINEAIVRQR